MKLTDFEPLTASDVKVGGEYISVCAAMDQSLSVSRIKVLTPWNHEGKFRSLVTFGNPGEEDSYETDEYMEGLGAPIKPRQWPDNYHRLFLYTPEAYDFFRQFVQEQRQIEWLTFMGVKEPERAIAAGIKESDAFMRTVEYTDSMNPLDAINFLIDDINSQRIH